LTRNRVYIRIAAALCILALMAPNLIAADTLDKIREEKRLLWGGDQEGGGPYIFPREDKPSEVTGFEVELAARLSEYLKVRSEFSQGPWDKLPDLLRSGKLHVIIDGYEFTPDRVESMDSTIPYYIYDLQLLARKAGGAVDSWEDLKKKPNGVKLKVGVLTASAADNYATMFCGDDCEVVRYDGTTDAMREVETTKLAATLQDGPIASFYGPRFPNLKKVGAPVAPGYYVMYVQKGEERLVKALNEAIILMLHNGDLERIYKKYGIWNDTQKELTTIADGARRMRGP
jgi:polar amino acid transport system substrate-binding protein